MTARKNSFSRITNQPYIHHLQVISWDIAKQWIEAFNFNPNRLHRLQWCLALQLFWLLFGSLFKFTVHNASFCPRCKIAAIVGLLLYGIVEILQSTIMTPLQCSFHENASSYHLKRVEQSPTSQSLKLKMLQYWKRQKALILRTKKEKEIEGYGSISDNENDDYIREEVEENEQIFCLLRLTSF